MTYKTPHLYLFQNPNPSKNSRNPPSIELKNILKITSTISISIYIFISIIKIIANTLKNFFIPEQILFSGGFIFSEIKDIINNMGITAFKKSNI